MSSIDTDTIYEAIGGAETFWRIVENFYNAVHADKPLYAIYPQDLEESKRTLALFLIQYFGGPRDYSDERGHPRMRMRHAPFAIGQAERDGWMHHMTNAVKAEELPPEIEAAMLQYFDRTATFMMNR
jgi:hemoglobin